ncbi:MULTISPECIES: gamma-glutamyltransferase [unclassified Pseudomonas]|uniref:gamma-glutamyltransferase n=1 Tax=unclassified Pseudomonas TaxID=196821 RepID=UPI003917DDF2
MVSTSHPIAAPAGVRILLAGGTAIAAAATLVVEPVSCGLGSNAFAMVWDGRQRHGLNASRHAPSAWDLEHFRKRYGEDGRGHAVRPVRGWDAVTIPGAVRCGAVRCGPRCISVSVSRG